MSKPFIQQFREAVRDTQIPSTDKLVLRTMADYANSAGESVRASYATLAVGAGVDRRTCIRAIKRTQKAGWLVQVRSGKSAGVPSEYQLQIGQSYEIDYSEGLGSATSVREPPVTELTSDRNDPPLVTENTSTSDRDAPQPRVSTITRLSRTRGRGNSNLEDYRQPLSGLSDHELEVLELTDILGSDIATQYASLTGSNQELDPVDHRIPAKQEAESICVSCGYAEAECFCETPNYQSVPHYQQDIAAADMWE